MIVDTPERVWHFTSTGWTAIGSIVGAASVLALSYFNWRYLRLTHELSESAAAQATAAQTQATIAQESLKRLEEQISSDVLTKRHAALAVLRETQNRIRYWISNFRSEEVSEPILLRPDWNVLVAYTSHHLPEAYTTVAKASQGLHIVELELNRLVAVPLRDRNPNSSLQVRFNGLETNMEDMRKLLDEAYAVFYSRPASSQNVA